MAKDVAVSAEMSNSLMGLAAELGWHDLAAAGDRAAILGRASPAPAQQLHPAPPSRKKIVDTTNKKWHKGPQNPKPIALGGRR